MARLPERRPGPSPRSELVYFFSAAHSFSEYSRVKAWSPAVNVYRLADRVEVCVDLAGIDRRGLHVQVERGRLSIRGLRDAPQPPLPQAAQPREGADAASGAAPPAPPLIHIQAMEIEHGPFCRVIDVPHHVDLDRVESEYKDGLLWVRLPLRA